MMSRHRLIAGPPALCPKAPIPLSSTSARFKAVAAWAVSQWAVSSWATASWGAVLKTTARKAAAPKAWGLQGGPAMAMPARAFGAMLLGAMLAFCAATGAAAQTAAQTAPAPKTAEARPVGVALDWMLNTNHIGLVIARERGFYDAEGLAVELLPYSDTSSTALLAAGAADFGYLTSLGFLSARAAGAPLTALWATMQQETGRLVYNADNPAITRPADLSGKTYAGFGSAWEAALIGAMIRADGGDPVWDTVTLGTGAYEALATGAVDFTLEVATWEGVNGQLLGRRQAAFRYADYGIPDQQNGYIAARAATLAEDPELVAAFLRATEKGYAWAADHPAEAAEILIAAGDFPNPALVRGSMQALAAGGYLRDAAGEVGRIDLPRFTAMARFLHESGVLKGADGQKLAWPGDVSDWQDQSWRSR